MTDIILDEGWIAAKRILGTDAAIMAQAIDRTVGQEALFYQGEIKKGFRTQAPAGQRFKPLSPLTIAIRRFSGFGGTKALVVRGDLRNSIKVVKESRAKYFVGVLRTAKGRDGRSLVNIAQIHEFGTGPIVIQVTKKMRGFLAAAFTAAFGGISQGGGGFSTGIIVTRVPARPFFRPVFEKFGRPAEQRRRFLWRLSKILNGTMGVVPRPPKV